MSSPSNSNEIQTFKDFLDKINLLPTNPKYSSFDSTGSSVPNQNSSTPIKGASIVPPPSKPTNLTLNLKPIRGEVQTLRLTFTENVGQLRVKVAELFSISEAERCRLIRGGKALSDDDQSVETIFGLVSEPQTLHVLEKPPTALSTTVSLHEALKATDNKIWSKIDNLLQNEAGIIDEKERQNIIEKFRKSLN